MPERVMLLMDRYLGQGGSENHIQQLIAHLDRSRYAPAVAALRPTRYLERCPPPCPWSVLGIRKLAHPGALARMLAFAWRLRRDGFRIVHCFFNDATLIAPPVLRLFGIRTVVARRDMGFWQTPRTLAACRQVARFVDRYVVNARAVGEHVRAAERVPASKIEVLYNGYAQPPDDALAADRGRAARDLAGRRRIVGIVANLKPVKRIDVLLAAFARVADRFPDATLVVVGCESRTPAGGSTLDELRAASARLGLDGRVIFTGIVEQPVAYVERFDVAVLCSQSEGLSNAIIEYMACGKPVVCTDTGGNAELVRDGVDGFLVPVGDDGALAARIVGLLADPALAARMGAAGRDAVLARHGLSRMIEQQMACYDRLLATGGRHRAATAAGAE